MGTGVHRRSGRWRQLNLARLQTTTKTMFCEEAVPRMTNVLKKCYPKGFATLGESAMLRRQVRRATGKPRGHRSPRKIDVTGKLTVVSVSVVTLIRTDTTLDHSQKAEKVWWAQPARRYYGSVTRTWRAQTRNFRAREGKRPYEELKRCWEQRVHAGSLYQKLCCGVLHRSIHRSHRRQSAVTCSADREPPAWSWPSASQVSCSTKIARGYHGNVRRPGRVQTGDWQ